MKEKNTTITSKHKHNLYLIALSIVYFALILFIVYEWYFENSFINTLYTSAPKIVDNIKTSSEQVRPYGYNLTSYAINGYFIAISLLLYAAVGFISSILFYGFSFSSSRKAFPLIMLISTGIILCILTELLHIVALIEAKFAFSVINFIGYILGMLTSLVLNNVLKLNRTKKKGEESDIS